MTVQPHNDRIVAPAQPNVLLPTAIVEAVSSGRCILFLGAMASAETPEGCRWEHQRRPPSGGELSIHLAERGHYPHSDRENLQRVAMHYEFDLVHGGSRNALVEAVRMRLSGDFEPSPALQMLAALPFPIYITTNYDQLFDMALSSARTRQGRQKHPVIRVYNPSGTAEHVTPDPPEDRPVLLKLHGDIERPDSIVITEEDYITFIGKMANEHEHPIHPSIRMRLNSWPVLFIGYSLRDYNLRLLFRTLRWKMDQAFIPLSFSVDPSPDDLVVAVWQGGGRPMVNFIQSDLWNFVPALYSACLGRDFDLQR